MRTITRHLTPPCRLLATGLLLVLPLLAAAQEQPAGHRHQHGAAATPPGEAPESHAMHGEAPSQDRPEDHSHMQHAMPRDEPEASHDAMDPSMHGMHHGVPPVREAPDEPRSPDYSGGIGHGDMPGMAMIDDRPLAMLRVDQLEATHGRHANGQAWALQGWYGNDADKLWLRGEGERSGGRTGDGDAELLWSHAVAPFWDRQLGVREDLGRGPARHWAAFGIQGLAPYWFELEATAYAGPSGRTAARVRVEYELLFTQRLILQPEFEANLYGRDDPARRVGRGVADIQLGLRLRYEVRREFAPYVGVVWSRRHGKTAAYARQDGEPPLDRQWVAGVRFWF